MNYTKTILPLMLFMAYYCEVKGQDIHFSQYNQTPLIINPALTGMFNGNQRVLINYKDQWRSVTTPYTTYALSFDMAILKKKWEKGNLGIGVFAFSDKAGDLGFRTTQLNISLSAIINLNEKNKLSAGLQGGMAQRSVDYAKIKTDNQYVNGTYDPTFASGEASNFTSTSFGDFTAGMVWGYTNTEKNHYTKLGAAIYHFNKPEQDLYQLVQDRLYSRVAIHGSASVALKSKNWAIVPSFVYLVQGPTAELYLGSLIRYKLKEGSKYTKLKKETAISIGCFYRAGDAIIPTVLFEIASFAVGFSYDVNTSGLKAASSGNGGFEISLRFVNPNPFKNDKYIYRSLY